jgi:hypothetical protein
MRPHGGRTRPHVKAVRKVGRPRKDPIFGSDGLLLKAWKAKRKA